MAGCQEIIFDHAQYVIFIEKCDKLKFATQVWVHVYGIPNFIGRHFFAAGRIRTEQGSVCNYNTCILYRGVQQGNVYVKVLQGRLFFIEPGHDIHWDVKIKNFKTIGRRVDGHWLVGLGNSGRR